MTALTGSMKSTVDKIWNIMWTGGDSNPISILEQLTYLIFLHDLDVKDVIDSKKECEYGIKHQSIFDGTFISPDRREWEKDQFRWSNLKNVGESELFDTISNGVFPFIRSLYEKDESFWFYMKDARFGFPNEIILHQVFDQISMLLSKVDEGSSKDVCGDVYEYMISKMSTSKVNGQFRTPRHIIKMMVELMDPKIDDTVCDPACGTAGFLVLTAEHILKKYKDELSQDELVKNHFSNCMFTGFDKDNTMLRISAMNLLLHGVNAPTIDNLDSLSKNNHLSDKFSLILANPPFKGSLDKRLTSPDLLSVTETSKTELLFIAAILRMLRIGGRCAAIVPDGVLFGSSNAHVNIRKELIDRNKLEAVISMPGGVFRPYAGVSTAILIFTKTGNGGTDSVWFYDMCADGYSLDDKRSPVNENDIPDILERFKDIDMERNRSRTDKSFIVPVDEIIKNDYDLSINKYKKVVHEEVKYRSSNEILDEIDNLNEQIAVKISELRALMR